MWNLQVWFTEYTVYNNDIPKLKAQVCNPTELKNNNIFKYNTKRFGGANSYNTNKCQAEQPHRTDWYQAERKYNRKQLVWQINPTNIPAKSFRQKNSTSRNHKNFLRKKAERDRNKS